MTFRLPELENISSQTSQMSAGLLFMCSTMFRSCICVGKGFLADPTMKSFVISVRSFMTSQLIRNIICLVALVAFERFLSGMRFFYDAVNHLIGETPWGIHRMRRVCLRCEFFYDLLDPVHTGPDEFETVLKFVQIRLAFTRDHGNRTNSSTICRTNSRPKKARSVFRPVRF